jgi:hypothetical protein
MDLNHRYLHYIKISSKLAEICDLVIGRKYLVHQLIQNKTRVRVRLTTFYSIQFGTKKYIRVPPLKFFSTSVKYSLVPP